MIKQVVIAIVLTSLLIGNSWDAEARERSAAVQKEKIVDSAESESKVREKRFINPLSSLFSVWNAITHIYSLYVEVSHFILCVIISRSLSLSYLVLMMLLIFQQKNETYFALEQTHDIIADGFNDTYMATKRPTVSLHQTRALTRTRMHLDSFHGDLRKSNAKREPN